jgi:hypothetical protein
MSRLFVGVGAALMACAGLVALFSGAGETEDLWRPIGIFTGIAVLALIMAVRMLGFDWFSAPVVYLSYLWLFHFPLVLFGCLIPATLGRLPPHIYRWTLVPGWYRAALISLTCAAAFTAGVTVISSKSGDRRRQLLRNEADVSLAWLGLVEALLGVGFVVSCVVQGGGRQAFETSYIKLYDSVFAGSFGYGVVIFTIGISIALAGVRRRQFPVLLGVGVLWACVMLLLGARSAALFCALMAVIVLVKRGAIVPRWIAVGAVVAVFWLAAVVGVARQGAVQDNLAAATDSSPLDALLEMGGSLYTVSLFDNWVLSGDNLQLGGGYWLPFERAIGLLLPNVRSDLATDPRAASQVLLSRASGLGGSVVAEAYYNFGPLAPLIVFVPLGLLMAYLDRSARASVSTAWLIVLFYPLLMEVRDWFISVPAMIALGAIPLLMLKQWQRSRHTTPVSVRPQSDRC